jgi:hypothetical protein
MSTIREGDLVMVVRTCCSATAAMAVGIPWVVGKVYTHPSGWYCDACGANTPNAPVKFARSATKFGQGCDCAPFSWLKKIPPLSEPSHTERREEIEA